MDFFGDIPARFDPDDKVQINIDHMVAYGALKEWPELVLLILTTDHEGYASDRQFYLDFLPYLSDKTVDRMFDELEEHRRSKNDEPHYAWFMRVARHYNGFICAK